MKTVPLGKLTDLVSSGSTPRGGAKVYLNNGPVMLIRSQNVLMRELDLSHVAFITDEIANTMRRTVVQKNDVLLNITGASIGRVSTFEIESVDANVNQHVCIIRPISELLEPRYLMHFIARPKFQNRINSTQNGGTRQALTFSQIRNFQIPLPPIEEQRRIAAILDKADAVRRDRKQAIQYTEDLLRSAFLDMFGDPVTNPKRWNTAQLGTIVDITSGQVDPREVPYSQMPHVGGNNIMSGSGEITGCKTSKELSLISGKYLFHPGDILYSKIRPYLNKVAVPDFEGICSADIYPIQVKKKYVTTLYIASILRSKGFLDYAEKHSTRTNIPKINRKAMSNYECPLPPLSIQKRFETLAKRILGFNAQIEVMRCESDDLFNSLLQRAFKGEL